MTSNLPLLQPRLLLGLRTDIQGNAQFITDEDILYPVGSVLTIHNHNQKRQKYIKLGDKGRNVTSIVVSPNKKLIAVVESGDTNRLPFVTLWCPITYKKKRQINLPTDKEIYATKFTAVAFTFDSKCIMCVTGEPDWTLYVFRCDKGKLESTARANNTNGTGTVRQIACNPNDVNLITLIGDNLIRSLACNEYVWKQVGYSKSDQCSFTSATWLSQDRLIVGSSTGRILILEGNELKTILFAGDLPVIDLKTKDELQQVSQTSLKIPSDSSMAKGEDHRILALTSFPRGFAFAYLTGTVHLYEMETPHKYNKRNVFRIPDHTIMREYEGPPQEKLTTVNCISINPTQGRLMVTCNESQIYNVTLWTQDSSTVESVFSEYGPPLHHGPIGGMAVCSWKPILLTAGKSDRTLKIWNYETEELELMQQFQDDLFGVALHPSGHYAIVGFSDKLRFLTIMIEEFETTREFSIRLCKQCSFSKLGHFFAAANGNVIQIYSSVSFEMLYILKGHNGMIFGMSWTNDDRKMASCGNEGAVYEWIISESRRSSETIIKQCVFNGVAITTDGKSILAVSNDGHIRELVNSNVHRDVTVHPSGLDSIVLSRIDLMLFVSGNSGTVYNIKLPLLEKAEYVEYNLHGSTVTQMLISYDDRYLFTGSLDGSMCIWKLLNIEGKAIKMDKDFTPSRDILISRQVLEEKIATTKNLQMRLKELETEYAYQLRQNDVVNALRMKEVHSGYCQAIEELKEKNEQMENDHIQEIHNINLDIKHIKQNHEEFVRELEANYNEKLIFEYEKFLRLEEKMEKMRRDYEKELDDLRQAKKESEEKITNGFLEKLEEKQMKFDELLEQTARKTKAHEMIKQQIEEDADREIYELRAAHAKELREEQDLNVKIRGETAIVKKKLITSLKEIDDYKSKVYMLENDHTKLKKSIINLEKDIADLKKEISERDATIQDKEKRIFELKRKNQELEKFKFILDFKIKELKSQIEPREQMIVQQTEQINAMVKELENLQKIILNLDLQLHELREKLFAADGEVKKQVAKNMVMKRALNKIKTDIYLASGCVQNVPLLIKTVKEMYHKFNIDEDFELAQAEDTEVKSEFLRQREFLERTVNTLQHQVNRSTTTLGYDKVKLTEENATLLVETNQLRKELKLEQKKKDKLESILGVNSQKYLPPKVALEKVLNATATRDEIRNEYKKTIEDRERCINVLRDENDRLVNKILTEHSSEHVGDEGGQNETYTRN